MATEGNVNFLPLEGLGVSGKDYSKASTTSLQFQPLTVTAYQVEHSSIAMTLPELELFMTMGRGSTLTLDALLSLDNFTMTSRAGARIGMVLPDLVLSFHSTSAETSQIALVMDPFTMGGSVQSGTVGTFALTLPALSMSSRAAMVLAGTLPALTMEFLAHREETCSLNLTLPPLQITGNVSVVSYSWPMALTLPAFTMGSGGRIAMTMAPFEMVFTSAPVGLSDGWLMNVRNGAITRVTAWPFKQWAKVGSKLFAVGPDGLYEMGGDFQGDGTTPIAWSFETGLSDLGSPAIKHVPYLYMDAIIDGEIEITLVDDKGQRYRYIYDGQHGAQHMTHRRKLGNAIRTRNVAFNIASPKGAYGEFDALEPEVNQTERSI